MNLLELHDYQKTAVSKAVENGFYALWITMGLGKSAISVTAIKELFDEFLIHKVLIIAPLRVCLNTWPVEIDKWSDMKFIQLAGLTTAKRTAALNRKASIFIVNRELIPWLVEYYKNKWPFDMVVIDEASSFKNPSSKRFKALNKVRPFIKRMLQLTGSPAPNGLLDIYAPIKLLDKGERLGRTITQYKQRYFTSDYMGWVWTIREGCEPLIYNKVDDITLSMKSIDYLDMPEVVYNNIYVELPNRIREIYKELQKEMYVQLSDEEHLNAVSAAVVSNKCLQVANGTVYLEDTEKDLHDEKLKALDSIIGEAEGNPILVAYNFKSDLRKIKKQFKQAIELDKKPATVEKWNRKEIPLLVAHPASCGHGLNLQEGGFILVWYGMNWSLELYEQMNARLHRQGQKETVFIHHIMASDTVDENVLTVLEGKATVQEALMEATKEVVRKRLIDEKKTGVGI